MAAKKKEEKEAKPKLKKGDNIPSRAERAAALMADVNKKMAGRAILKSASDYVMPWAIKRVPTGLLTMDVALRGGFPCGGLSQVIGRRNSGKTLSMWLAVRQLQHMLGDKMMVLLAMTELTADRDQARKAGVKIALGKEEVEALNHERHEKGLPPLTKKEIEEISPQIGTIHELHAMTAEDFYDVVLRAVEENTYHLIVIDSIGNALANAEQENESVKDKTYGGTSAPNTTFLKKLTNLLTMETEWGGVRDTCVIGINQVRDNIKDPNAPYKSPGGNALEHAKLVDIFMESGAIIGEEIPTQTPQGLKKVFKQTGKEVNWKIVKGKAGMHEGEKGKLLFSFGTSNFDFILDHIVAGLTHGVVEQAGAWLSIADPDTGEILIKSQGRDAFVKALTDDAIEKWKEGRSDTLLNHIREAVFRKKNINIRYDNWD